MVDVTEDEEWCKGKRGPEFVEPSEYHGCVTLVAYRDQLQAKLQLDHPGTMREDTNARVIGQPRAGRLTAAILPVYDVTPGDPAHWVEPRLVAEVRYTEWTGDGSLRHPAILGLREDKAAREVVRKSIGRGAG